MMKSITWWNSHYSRPIYDTSPPLRRDRQRLVTFTFASLNLLWGTNVWDFLLLLLGLTEVSPFVSSHTHGPHMRWVPWNCIKYTIPFLRIPLSESWLYLISMSSPLATNTLTLACPRAVNVYQRQISGGHIQLIRGIKNIEFLGR